MIGYKIEYGTVGHDCWGALEFSWDGDYNGIVYTDYNECEKEMNKLKKEHLYDMEFRIYNVEIR